MPDFRPKDAATAGFVGTRYRLHPAELALYLFLGSLAMLFSASLIAYLSIRLGGVSVSSGSHLEIPAIVWISTAALLATSWVLHQSLVAVRREKQRRMRQCLLVAMGLAWVFLLVQTWSLADLLHLHWLGLERRMGLYGVVFALVGLHAVHVIGGMVVLSTVTLRGFQYRYDHECYRGVKLCATYWHFLDVVWLVMLGTFLATA